MCCRTLLAHKQTHGHEGNKKKTRNRDFRGDFEKRRKLIPGGALLTFARLSFQSFFREPKLGLKNGRIWGGKKEKKKEEIERDKWQRGSEDKGWRMNTMRSFREKKAQGRVAVSKTKRKLERFFFNTFFHNSRKTAYLPSFSSSSSSSFSPSISLLPNFVLLSFSDCRWNYLHVPGFVLQRTCKRVLAGEFESRLFIHDTCSMIITIQYN